MTAELVGHPAPLVQVWVKILEVQEDASGTPRINCSMKAVDQESGKDLDPENRMTTQRRGGGMSAREGPVSEEPPELGSVHRATIASLRPFGAFVRLEGFRSNGLIHFSQARRFQPNTGQEHLAAQRLQRTDRAICVTLASLSLPLSCLQIRLAHVRVLFPVSGSCKCCSRRQNSPRLCCSQCFSRGLPTLSGMQISDHLEVDREASDEEKTATIGSVLSVRETVWVKVVEIKEADPGSDRGPKIGCSIKLVSQKDGRDLDPHSLKYKPRQMEGGSGSKPLVGADAGQAQQGAPEFQHLET